jgi:hypothetical protein
MGSRTRMIPTHPLVYPLADPPANNLKSLAEWAEWVKWAFFCKSPGKT